MRHVALAVILGVACAAGRTAAAADTAVSAMAGQSSVPATSAKALERAAPATLPPPEAVKVEVVEGRVVIDDQKVIRLDALGRKRWTVDLGQFVNNSHPPNWVAHHGKVFVSLREEMVALDDQTGAVLWRSPGANGRLLTSGDLLMAVDCASDPVGGRWLKARNIEDGHEVWKVRLPDECEPHALLAVGDLFLVRSGELLREGLTYVVDRSGTVRLKLDEFVFSGSMAGQEILLAGNRSITRMTLDGQVRWTIPTPRRWKEPCPFSTAEFLPLPNNDFILFFYGPISDSGVEVWRLDGVKGTIRWETHCPSLGVIHSMYTQHVIVTISGDRLVVVSLAGGGNFREDLSLATGESLRRNRISRLL